MQRPNIVYLNSHDSGRAISPDGCRARTPHLQALAERGVCFRNAHSAAPTCSPSRAALVTGQYPHSCGMLGLGNRGFVMQHLDHHIAHTLAGAGYQTVTGGLGGHNHTCNSYQGAEEPWQAVGYQRLLEGNLGAVGADFVAERHERPFFLSLSWGMTHRQGTGFASEADAVADDPRYVALPPTLPDDERTRADWAHYLSDMHRLDAEMGQVIDAIAAAGLSENTLIIATTDHGPPFPGMKCQLTRHGTGVFLLMAGPGYTGGRVVDALVSQIDVFPSICAAAGIDLPAWAQGVALDRLAAGETDGVHEQIVAEVSYHAAYEPKRAIRDGRYCYIRRWGDYRHPVGSNCDRSPSKDCLLEQGWRERVLGEEELYDCLLDPEECHDLAGDPAHAAIRERLRDRLDRWMQESADPLCSGSVPQPPGTWVDPQDSLHPGANKPPAGTLG